MADHPHGDHVVAVDLGGTLTKVARAYPDGSTGPTTRLPTVVEDGQVPVPWLAEVLTGAVAPAGGPDAGRCVGYGVVVPGVIDVPRGVVRAAPNVGWSEVPLRHRLTELTGGEGVVGHDVRAGGLAEWRRGAGRGAANLLFLALGTGVAGAVVADGRLVEADGYAGEVGHLAVPAAGDAPCACGQRGCLEVVASAAGVVRRYAALSGEVLDGAQAVADRARAGDPDAAATFALVVEALTEALAACATLLGPEVVVVGGGLAGAFDLIGSPVRAGLDARMTFQRRPRLVPAAFGADSGVVGAGLLAWDRIDGKET